MVLNQSVWLVASLSSPGASSIPWPWSSRCCWAAPGWPAVAASPPEFTITAPKMAKSWRMSRKIPWNMSEITIELFRWNSEKFRWFFLRRHLPFGWGTTRISAFWMRGVDKMLLLQSCPRSRRNSEAEKICGLFGRGWHGFSQVTWLQGTFKVIGVPPSQHHPAIWLGFSMKYLRNSYWATSIYGNLHIISGMWIYHVNNILNHHTRQLNTINRHRS